MIKFDLNFSDPDMHSYLSEDESTQRGVSSPQQSYEQMQQCSPLVSKNFQVLIWRHVYCLIPRLSDRIRKFL